MCGGLGAWYLDFTFHEASVSGYIKRCELIMKSQSESKAVEWLLSTHYPIYHLSIHIILFDSLRRRAENTGTKENTLCFYTTSHASLVHKIPPFTNPCLSLCRSNTANTVDTERLISLHSFVQTPLEESFVNPYYTAPNRCSPFLFPERDTCFPFSARVKDARDSWTACSECQLYLKLYFTVLSEDENSRE